MSDSVIDGAGFHGQRGQSVHKGEIFEALTQACVEKVFSEEEGWCIVPQYQPQYEDFSLADILDLGIFKISEESEKAERALILEITHWKDEENVEEEPNKSYKCHETLEKFSFLGSRIRAEESKVKGLPKDTMFGNIIFGNRRYVRKWIPTQFESFLDFVSYPSYEPSDSEPATPDVGAERALKEKWNEHSRSNEFMESLKQDIVKESGIIGKTGNRLVEELREYKGNDFPQSPLGSVEYKARYEYRNSEEYQRNIKFLNRQIDFDGMPANRFKLKTAFKKASAENVEILEDVSPSWKPIIEYILKQAAERVPEIEEGREILEKADDFLPKILEICKERSRKELKKYWNHSDEAKRIAYRNILRTLYEEPVDNFYDIDNVTEQNFSKTVYNDFTTQKILNRLMKQIEINAKNRERQKWIEDSKQKIKRSLDYQAVNKTSLNPTKWALEYLISESNMEMGKDIIRNGSWNSFTDKVDYESFKNRLITFEDEDMWRSVSPRAEFTLGDHNKIFIKSKFTKNEASRRAREEGNKAWGGKLRISTKNDIETSFSHDKWWMWVDGYWENKDDLKRLIECGWRIYLDPMRMVKDLKDRKTSLDDFS